MFIIFFKFTGFCSSVVIAALIGTITKDWFVEVVDQFEATHGVAYTARCNLFSYLIFNLNFSNICYPA